MPIHHMQQKAAEKAGFSLEEIGDAIRAFWPEQNIYILAKNGAEAVRQMHAIQASCIGGDYTMEPDKLGMLVTTIRREDNNILAGSPMLPTEAYEVIAGGSAEWSEPQVVPPTEIARSDKGVPLDGKTAYIEKFAAGDCPYSSETEDEEEYALFTKWNEEWDAAADKAEEEKPGGSVVKDEYRARYSEMGHPTHCGDDLAVILNNLCQTEKNGTDLNRFEAICEANGVNLSKYNRTSLGWQGRLRMTGRNLLARKVWENGGVLKTPVEGAEPQYQMSQEWMVTRKFAKAG